MLNSKIGYKIYDNVFSSEECKNIITYCEKNGTKGNGNFIGENVEDTYIRSSKITWIEDNHLYQKIMPIISDANKSANWCFNLLRIEPLQFTRYDIGDKYEWHFDMDEKVYGSNHPLSGLLRKISFSILLSDDFKGGEFQIETGHPGIKDRIHTVEKFNKIGSILIFPSYLPHRVLPVTEGIRNTLVGWCCGPPWK
jgi:PKHD-type hydroxylase